MDRREPEQRLEGGHRRVTPIEAEGELVELDLEVSMTDAVVSADQPAFRLPKTRAFR